MASSEVLEKLLDEFGQRAGLDRLRLDKDGICALAFDDRVLLHVAATDDPDDAVLYVALGPVPPGRELELFRRMLEGNLAAGEGGSTLGLDPSSGALMLRRVQVARMSAGQFEHLIEQVAEEALAWLDLLRASQPETPTEPAAGNSLATAMLRA
jgi:hypothetical protein